MTWEGKHPEVVLVETPYSKGVRVGPKEMEELESQVVRLPSLEKWFVAIPSGPAVDSGEHKILRAPQVKRSGQFNR